MAGSTKNKRSKETESAKKLDNQSSFPSRILVADDDPMTCRVMDRFLRRAGHKPIVVQDGVTAMETMSDDTPVALLDLNMPNASGMDVLAFIRSEFQDAQVIIVSGVGEIRDAVNAMKAGACDFITKPVNVDELLAIVDQAIQRFRLASENRGLRAVVSSQVPAKAFTANAESSKQLLNRINKVAPLDSSVLITGESGTGKSTIARLIHQHSPRSEGPFVAVNCASLPRDLIESELFGHAKGAFTGAVEDRPGRIEFAGGGTLFLDEIGDLPLELQPKLLTFLQEKTVQRVGCNETRKVDVRVLSATHQDLETMCQDGGFRQDLYYRLNVLHLAAPALRTRSADIMPLAAEVLDRLAARVQMARPEITKAAAEQLEQYHWPGNIRELENVLERAFAFCQDNRIDVADLSQGIGGQLANTENTTESGITTSIAGRSLAELECQAIKETLESCGGNKSKSARILGISQKSIYNKMRRHGLL